MLQARSMTEVSSYAASTREYAAAPPPMMAKKQKTGFSLGPGVDLAVEHAV